jgi:hypothetical protein
MLFFLRFRPQARDGFFLLFALAFGVDAVTRFLLGLMFRRRRSRCSISRAC